MRINAVKVLIKKQRSGEYVDPADLEKAKAQERAKRSARTEGGSGDAQTAKPAATEPDKARATANHADEMTPVEPPQKKRRRRKADSEKMERLIGAHLTEAEYAIVLASSQRLGLMPGRYLVDCALKKTAEILAAHHLFTETQIEQLIERSVRRGATKPGNDLPH